MSEEIDYDEEKSERNLKMRGISFPYAARIFEGDIVAWPDRRYHYGEERYIAMGLVDGRVIVVVYTWRGHARRIISARKANRRERNVYYSYHS
jgi:hypothetical protein